MVSDFFTHLFSSQGFMPHGHCYQWQPLPFWTSVISDFLIAASYFAIALLIYLIVRQRKELRFRGIFILFSLFILLCGITHLMALIGMWKPYYRLDALLKLATALISATTAIVLIVRMHDIRRIPTADQYRQTLAELEKEHLEKIRADEANQAKSTFLSNMSHELRTPLSSILCGLDIVSSFDQSEAAREVTDIARDSSRHLLNLINDVLDLSKIEAGELTLSSEPFTATSVVGSVCDMLNLQAKGKGLEFRTLFDEPSPVILVGDPNRLTQIATNIIGNAVKFTQKGSVEVRMQLNEISKRTLELQLEVEDSGPGITPGDLKEIFIPFKQSETMTDANLKGTGLGLSITNKLVQLMNGKITVDSEVGKGTCFTITIPFLTAGEEMQRQFLDASDREADLVLKDKAEKRLSILLVEDNSASERIVRKILELRGHRIASASNIEQALRLFCTDSFDVAIMDVRLGRESGLDCVQQMRKMEKSGNRLPIVGLSAQFMSQDREAAIEAGIDQYLVKPVSAARLVGTIELHGGRHQGSDTDRS